MVEGPGADSEEKHEPVGDIDTAAADSLKVLDLKRPIREADIDQHRRPDHPITGSSDWSVCMKRLKLQQAAL